jgi:hypothetical protein
MKYSNVSFSNFKTLNLAKTISYLKNSGLSSKTEK